MFVRAARATLVALAILPLGAGFATAAAPGAVEVTLDANFVTGAETFTASGAFCDAGTATTDALRIVGGGRGLSFHVVKTLTCEDGSGSLTISVNAATHAGGPGDQGGWSVVTGSGDWSSASGGGRVVGTYYDGGIVDEYGGVIQRRHRGPADAEPSSSRLGIH